MGTKSVKAPVTELGPNKYRVSVTGQVVPPEFMTGLLEEGLNRTKAKPLLKIENALPTSFDVVITW